jgi:hypothetical protein
VRRRNFRGFRKLWRERNRAGAARARGSSGHDGPTKTIASRGTALPAMRWSSAHVMSGHKADDLKCPRIGRYRGESGRDEDVAEPTRMTRLGRQARTAHRVLCYLTRGPWLSAISAAAHPPQHLRCDLECSVCCCFGPGRAPHGGGRASRCQNPRRTTS